MPDEYEGIVVIVIDGIISDEPLPPQCPANFQRPVLLFYSGLILSPLKEVAQSRFL